MIDLHEHHAQPLRSVPVKLEHVRDIEAYDGLSLLSEFKTSKNETYLYYWCDFDESLNVHRWAILRSPRQLLSRYEGGVASMRDLISNCPDGFCYIVDLNGDPKPQDVWYIDISSLPEAYLPDAEAFRAATTVTSKNFQDIATSEHWGAEGFSDYPRKYKQATTFTALFNREFGAVEEAKITYRLTQGYVFKNLYDVLRKSVPISLRAEVEEVAFASPGYLRFAVDPQVATTIRSAVKRFQERYDLLLADAKELRRWANFDPDKKPSKRTLQKSTALQIPERQAKRFLQSLCEGLEIDAERLLDQSDSLRTAAKALLSYHLRIKYLAETDSDQRAVMVGLSSEKRTVHELATISDTVKVIAATPRRRLKLEPPRDPE